MKKEENVATETNENEAELLSLNLKYKFLITSKMYSYLGGFLATRFPSDASLLTRSEGHPFV